MNQLERESSKKQTARQLIVQELSGEILKNCSLEDCLLASEHQLCRRFGVSRVTVRLALGELENLGLIYRQHGKGTFAYGRSKRARRNFGILFKSCEALKQTALIEIIRGIRSIIVPLHSSLVLIHTSPLEWRPEMIKSMAAVVVMPEGVTTEELTHLIGYPLPFCCIEESRLRDVTVNWFKVGASVAERLTGSTDGQPRGYAK